MGKHFPKATKQLIKSAKFSKDHGAKLTKSQRLLLVMKDGGWHEGYELATKVSWRFGGYLFDLKQKGVEWEKRPSPNRPKGERIFQYRLKEKDDD